MTDSDIVARLRESDGGYFMRQMFTEAADEIERLRKERDEARWRLCKVVGGQRDMWGCDIAKEYGWDYLNEEAKA